MRGGGMSTPNQHLHDRFTDEALTAIEARLHRIYKKAADGYLRMSSATLYYGVFGG